MYTMHYMLHVCPFEGSQGSLSTSQVPACTSGSTCRASPGLQLAPSRLTSCSGMGVSLCSEAPLSGPALQVLTLTAGPGLGSAYMAQRRSLLVHASHRVFYEGGVGHICGPGVPSVDERRTALLVPLNANPKAFSPDGRGEREPCLPLESNAAASCYQGRQGQLGYSVTKVSASHCKHFLRVRSSCLGDAKTHLYSQ